MVPVQVPGEDDLTQNMTNNEWEAQGVLYLTIPLENVRLSNGALNDTKMSFLFRGLMSSNAIKYMQL